jgi:hypothetical protein
MGEAATIEVEVVGTIGSPVPGPGLGGTAAGGAIIEAEAVAILVADGIPVREEPRCFAAVRLPVPDPTAHDGAVTGAASPEPYRVRESGGGAAGVAEFLAVGHRLGRGCQRAAGLGRRGRNEQERQHKES